MKTGIMAMRFAAVLLALTALISVPCAVNGETVDDPGLAPGAEIRIMSFNIMHPDWSRVPVKGREEIVAEILRYYMPDVAAIQEAGAKWHKALIPLLADTGEFAFACRKSNAEGFIYNATCFLYNPRTVRVIEEEILDLDPRDAARVLAVAVFERLTDGARFIVANTHPAPRDQEANYARNMADLKELAAGVVKAGSGLPVIIAGDFNTPEQSEMYLDFMKETGVRDAKYEADTLVRSCSTYIGYPSVPDPDDRECCVDHLFVAGPADVRLFNTVIGHGVETATDHLPIYADISLGE